MVIRAIQGLEIPKRHSFRIFGTGICDIEWVKPLGVKSLGWWGMTETVSHGIIGDVYTPNHPGSMGRPAAEYEIAIVNANHRPTEPGEIGDLLIRGVPGLSIFAEYLFDKAATLESFTPDGWFKTGDLVVLQQDGHITFSDRAKDMIRVGGENVAASEIERVIRAVGGVTDVAVVRKPDRKLDEVPVAFVTGTGDHAQLRLSIAESCKNNLADFKIPREVYVVDTLPRGILGKINKVCLRQAAARGESTFDSGLDWDGTAVP